MLIGAIFRSVWGSCGLVVASVALQVLVVCNFRVAQTQFTDRKIHDFTFRITYLLFALQQMPKAPSPAPVRTGVGSKGVSIHGE